MEQINLIQLIGRLWAKKIYILAVTACFAAFSVVLALILPEKFTSTEVFVPQVSRSSSSMASLAALAGVNVATQQSADLSPYVYKQIFSSPDFQRELMYSEFDFEEYGRQTLYAYYVDCLETIKPSDDFEISYHDSLAFFTSAESKVAEVIVNNIISLAVMKQDGYLTLSAVMPERIAAYQVCIRAHELLQKFVTIYRTSKATAYYENVRGLYEEAKADFEAKQEAFASFSDSHLVISTSKAKVERTRLQMELNVARNLYEQLTTNLLNAELKVREDTPNLTIVSPASIPYQRTSPKRSILCVVLTFLGGVIACGSVFFLDYIKRSGSAWPKRWTVE